MKSQAALDLIIKEFDHFPDNSNLNAFQEKSNIFLNDVDLFMIENKHQADFVSRLYQHYSQLQELQVVNSKHPFRMFTNEYSKLYDVQSYKEFEKILDKYLSTKEFPTKPFDVLPDMPDCNVHLSTR